MSQSSSPPPTDNPVYDKLLLNIGDNGNNKNNLCASFSPENNSMSAFFLPRSSLFVGHISSQNGSSCPDSPNSAAITFVQGIIAMIADPYHDPGNF